MEDLSTERRKVIEELHTARKVSSVRVSRSGVEIFFHPGASPSDEKEALARLQAAYPSGAAIQARRSE